MAETIKIGGELESMATGNVVAAASAIKDKVKNKYQGEINAETDATLTNHASAIQSLNSQNYVTVTATDQTTAVTDVLPAQGVVNAVYRVGNWDGSQFDASVYSEYAWNGSTYVHITTKTQIGEVFDISAYHATGGELAKYADLAAALGTNGANVPQSLRKGGMIIKFVQSSDNKYVQYRLMSNTFSIVVNNWQGVDVDPIPESDNLTISKGVYNAVQYVPNFFRKSPDYIVTVGGTTKTGTEKANILDTINKYIKGVYSINMESRLLVLTFLEVKSAGMDIYWGVCENKGSQPVETVMGGITKADLIANGYKVYMGVNYRNRMICIEFYEGIADYLDSLSSAIRIDGRNIDKSFNNIGIQNVEDVTNPVFNLNPLNFAMYGNAKNLWSMNACIKAVHLPFGKIGYIRYIEFYTNYIACKIEYCDYNSNGTVSNTDPTFVEDLDYYFYNGNVPEDRIITFRFGRYKNSYEAYVIVDLNKVIIPTTAGNSMVATSSYPVLAPFGNIEDDKPEIIYPFRDYASMAGYYNDIPNFVSNNQYASSIVPINKGCRKCIISCSGLNKYANIALLDETGYVIRWVWVNESDGRKYSGDEEKSLVNVDNIEEAKYLLVSVLTSNHIYSYIKIWGYDKNEVYKSINDARVNPDGALTVGSYILSKMGTTILSSSERNYRMLPMMQLQEQTESFECSMTGLTYTYNCLCDIDQFGTKYFIGCQSSAGNNYVMWKKAADGTKTLLFYGDSGDSWKLKNGNGETISLPEEYDGYGWFMYFWQSQYQTNGIKCLPDGELIIWLLTNKLADDNFKYHVCFKTSDNQSNLVPKFVFSNEHYVKNSHTYTSDGYIAANNGIDVLTYGESTLIAITEYGSGASEYWYDHGDTSKNGNGVVGKVWLSLDCGIHFKKIFDFDEKINGDADDESDNNWKWCDSKEYRMNVHMHGLKFDTYARKLFWTNGDGVDNLFYADIDDLISWYANYGNFTDPTDFDAKYTDNEVLCGSNIVFRYKIHQSGIGKYSPISSNGSMLLGNSYNIQPWCMLATNNALLFGHDTARQTITGVQHSLMKKKRETEMIFHIDLFAMLDEDAPSSSLYGIVENMIQRDVDTPIMAYHTKRGIFASYDGIAWKQVYKEDSEHPVTSFQGTFVVDPTTKDIYVVKRDSPKTNVGVYKILNY